MAVETIKASTKLGLTFVTGSDAKGEDVKKTMNLSKIKVIAADENLYATAKAIEPLLRYTVVSIDKSDVSNLSEV